MTSILILGLLFAASQAQATGLDPINNYCSRWYHQSQVKDGVLFIDGGIETFSDRSSNPNSSNCWSEILNAHDIPIHPLGFRYRNIRVDSI
ncbi:hypothetical protein FJTKL_14427 [Diaporthe vaccinii]|uniref:Uncharacterized protein n=1 Tax=Diaporthe vaccinii TaxID=105482 RepID=A0ABR4E7T8_9PEZI